MSNEVAVRWFCSSSRGERTRESVWRRAVQDWFMPTGRGAWPNTSETVSRMLRISHLHVLFKDAWLEIQ